MAKLFPPKKMIQAPTIKEYFMMDGVNWSSLKEMAKSPLQYKYRLECPREDVAMFVRGRAVHTAVLEPKRFLTDYVLFPGKIRRGKEWDAFAEEHADKTILKVDEYDKAWAAAEAVMRHPEARALLERTEREKTFTWRDEKTGLLCKCRVDAIGGALVDLKSTGDIDARCFGNRSARLMYHGQLAMYGDGAKHAGDKFIIAVESEPPHDVAVFEVNGDAYYAGQELYQGLLAGLSVCMKTNTWLGRYPMKQVLELPRYVFDEEQEDGTFQVVEEAEQ